VRTVSDYLFMVSLAILVIGVASRGLAYNLFRVFGNAKHLQQQGAREELFDGKERKKTGPGKIPSALMIIGFIGILVAIAISYL
jgi:hypothetical protein